MGARCATVAAAPPIGGTSVSAAAHASNEGGDGCCGDGDVNSSADGDGVDDDEAPPTGAVDGALSAVRPVMSAPPLVVDHDWRSGGVGGCRIRGDNGSSAAVLAMSLAVDTDCRDRGGGVGGCCVVGDNGSSSSSGAVLATSAASAVAATAATSGSSNGAVSSSLDPSSEPAASSNGTYGE